MLPHSKPYFERGTNDIGASARGHNFFARRDERRAHDRRVFAATTAAVALLEIADERAVFERKCKSWRKRKAERPLEILAQVVVDLVPAVAENLAGIENVFRIERAFDFAHHAEQLVAELLPHVFSARRADSVLGGKRAFELSNQFRSLIGDLPEFF